MSAVRKLAAWLAAWLGVGFPGQPKPIRAGMLNTGELVLIDFRGSVQVLSAEATDTVRDVLVTDSQAVSERVMLAAGAAGGTD